MPIQVETRDCAALTDADLDEMASMGGAFDIGVLSKAKEDWVLCTTARIDDKLHGCTFSTLERIGGTPCVLIGLMSVKRTSKRDQVLKGLMGEAFHRALMAFPDEDVVIGSRFVTVDSLEAFKQVDELIPRPGHRAVGEERAWGRRLAKRFGVDAELRRAVVRRQVQRPERVPRSRDAEAGEDQARARRPVRHGQPEEGWLAGRPRLGHGRGSVEAGRSLSDAQRSAHPVVEAVIRRRRMTREFSHEPLDPQLVADLVDTARRAPSAGYSQGVHFIVLSGDAVPRFWQTTDAEAWFAADAGRRAARAGDRPADRRSRRLHLALLRDRQDRPWPRRGRELAGAVLDDRHGDGGAEPAAAGRGASPWARCTSASSATPTCCSPISACPSEMLSVGVIAIGHRQPTDRPSGSATTRPRRPDDRGRPLQPLVSYGPRQWHRRFRWSTTWSSATTRTSWPTSARRAEPATSTAATPAPTAVAPTSARPTSPPTARSGRSRSSRSPHPA